MSTQLPTAPIVAFVGNYGSGKTEVAVNYALTVRATGAKVNVADLDIVNPYFRCREALEILEEKGIGVVVPRGHLHADLPILLPEIRGLLKHEGEISIFDVGGDDVGAKALSHLANDFPSHYEMLQVVNCRRPFTDTIEGCVKMKEEIESSSRLRITGLVSNSHLIGETTASVVTDGFAFAKAVGEATGLPVEMVVLPKWLELDPETFDVPSLVIDRQMTPPWLDDREAIGWAGERERLRLQASAARAQRPQDAKSRGGIGESPDLEENLDVDGARDEEGRSKALEEARGCPR